MRRVILCAVVLLATCCAAAVCWEAAGRIASLQDFDAPASLEQRVTELEKQLSERQPVLPTKGPRIIEANGFVLLNSQGRVAARLGFERMGEVDDVPGLYLFDENGTKRLVLLCSERGSGLGLYDKAGRGVIGFTSDARSLFAFVSAACDPNPPLRQAYVPNTQGTSTITNGSILKPKAPRPK